MQENSNLTPEEHEQTSALQTALMKLLCSYAYRVNDAHYNGNDIHAHLILDEKEIIGIAHVYAEAEERRVFHYD